MKTTTKGTIIACYSLEGKLVRAYPSAKKAATSIHVFSRTIDKAIREGRIIHEKQWKRVDKNNVPNFIEPYVKNETVLSIRPIAEIDEFNKVIATYPSVKKAAEFNHVDPHTIRDMLSGKTKFANGKKYRYLTDEEIEQFGYQKGKEINIKKVAIIQLDLDGKYIKTYKSISEAAREIGKPNRTQEIRDCLNGKYSTAFGFVWKYKDKENVKRKKEYIIQLLDNKVINKYSSVRKASENTGVSISSINNCIRGRQKTAGGYIWKRK